MSPPIRLLAFAGSLRQASFNRRLIGELVAGAEAAGAAVRLLDLREHALPIYDGDIEAAGMPAAVHVLQALLADSDGLLIATPEYNGAVPALVKNTLDWISRAQADGTPGTNLYRGKLAGICSASPGALGGLRALLLLRDQLAKLGMWVAPSQVAVGNAGAAFDEAGRLRDDKQRAAVHRVAAEVVAATSAMRAR